MGDEWLDYVLFMSRVSCTFLPLSLNIRLAHRYSTQVTSSLLTDISECMLMQISCHLRSSCVDVSNELLITFFHQWTT